MARIYKVAPKAGGAKGTLLVRAETKAGALRHVAEKTFEADVPTQDELITLAQSGVKVEEEKAEEKE